MSNSKVQIDLKANAQQALRVLKRFGAFVKRLGSNMRASLNNIGRGFLKAGAALGGAAIYLLKLYAAQEKAEVKLAAVIKATGGAAGYTSEQLQQMAADMQKVSVYSDEMTLSAMAVLATYKNIRGDQFRDAMEAAMDMTQVLETDLQGAMLQLGKAINEPVGGVSALIDVGVSFTDEQKKLIKTLVKSGDVMGAQKVILAELKGEFGGTAAAMAKTFGGRVEQLQNRLGDLGETIGKELLPGAEKLMKVIEDLTTNMEDGEAAASQMNTAMELLADTVYGVGVSFKWMQLQMTRSLAGWASYYAFLARHGDKLATLSQGPSGVGSAIGRSISDWITGDDSTGSDQLDILAEEMHKKAAELEKQYDAIGKKPPPRKPGKGPKPGTPEFYEQQQKPPKKEGGFQSSIEGLKALASRIDAAGTSPDERAAKAGERAADAGEKVAKGVEKVAKGVDKLVSITTKNAKATPPVAVFA